MAGGHDHRALDDVTKLPDVARPGILLQRRECRPVDESMRLPNAFENSSTNRHTSSGMSSTRSRSGGTANRKHIQAVVRVLAERSFGDPLFEIAVRRGDDPDVHANRLRAAEPLDRPLLQHPQQLHLHVERQVANLVEKDGRMIGHLEAPDLARQRAGKRAPSRGRTARFRSASAESRRS